MNNILYHHKWMDLCATKDNEAFIRMDDAVLMIALTQAGELILIEEQSIAYGDKMLTFPTGGIEADETPKMAAERELQEEIGYKAEKMELIGILRPSEKYAQWCYHVFLAQELTAHKEKGDERTPITIKIMLPNVIQGMIEAGTMNDSTAIAALSIAEKHIKTG